MTPFAIQGGSRYRTVGVVLIMMVVALAMNGCAGLRGHELIATLPTIAPDVDTRHLRASIVDIEMRYEDVKAALRASRLSPLNQEKYLALIDQRKPRLFVGDSEPRDDLGSELAFDVAPALLDKGQAAVRDMRSNSVVDHIERGWRHRGTHGPYYCLPDGIEFLHQILLEE
jgi:hypothetical protein